MFFDTHAHLDDARFDEDREALIQSFKENKIDLVLNIGSTLENSFEGVELSKKYDNIYSAAGIHPEGILDLPKNYLDDLEKLFENKKTVAVGEIGLDYHYDTPKDIQKRYFTEQLTFANRLKKPVIIHDRDAHADCLEIIKANLPEKFVFHCYSGSVEFAREILNLGGYISFTGVITFKNANKLPEVAKFVPLDRIFIETDCPYLSPEPFRGKRNSPLNVPLVAQKIAELRNESVEKIASVTKENAIKFFGIEL
ncbi:MAG: TatD family deoxyribonuclease [Ruminococcaceae bacterium]|nr:TatD family deoxyribonuclease [Oscillospiraceae bacterium]